MKLDLELQSFRCFTSAMFEVRPLTLLVGENSAGKTSTLGALNSALSEGFPFNSNFNTPPFELGNFSTIASRTKGPSGNAKSFCIKLNWVDRKPFKSEKDDELARFGIWAKYINDFGMPKASEVELTLDDISLKFDLNDDSKDSHKLLIRQGNKVVSLPVDRTLVKYERFKGDFSTMLAGALFRALELAEDKELLSRALALLVALPMVRPKAVAFAPVRSKPKRTYDVLSDEYRPEGDHVPFILRQELGSDGAKRTAIREHLKTFGRISGLYDDITVKELKHNLGSPFEIRVKIAGRETGLIDVGYGVSQALPIVVQLARLQPGSVALIQQPEVHLHPKAQAALGEYIAALIASSDLNIVLETHSDFIIDRIRTAVAQKKMDSEKFIMHFFEQSKSGARTSRIELDSNGNLIGAPSSYRKFFLEEQLRVLNR